MITGDRDYYKQFRLFNQHTFVPYGEGKGDTLLITVGDSWTFGDSLAGVLDARGCDDYYGRVNAVYGKLLADELKADWYNHGKCAGSNHDIAYSLHNALMSIMYDDYEKIYAVVNMTETCRHGWTEKFITNGANSKLNGEEFTKAYERLEFYDFYTLMDSFQNYNIELILTRNFTNSFKETDYYNLTVLPKNWVQINHEAESQDVPLKDIMVTGSVTTMALDFYEKYQVIHNNAITDYKDYFIRQVDRVKPLLDWLENSSLHYDRGSKHPTELSHRLWADYILENLK